MSNAWIVIGLIVVAGIAVGLVIWSLGQSEPGSVACRPDKPPREVVAAAVYWFTSGGWTTSAQTRNSATFSRPENPSCAIGLLLLLFGIVPALVYWLVARRTVSISVAATADAFRPGGSNVQISWSHSGTGEQPSLEFVESIAPGSLGIEGEAVSDEEIIRELLESSGPAGDVDAQALANQGREAAILDEPVGAGLGHALWGDDTITPAASSRAAVQSPVREVTGKPKFCTRCGSPATLDEPYCGECGARI